MSVDLSRYVRDVADFPKPGVVFKDLTPLLADARAFAASIEALVAPFAEAGIERVVGIEARGFIFGAAAAHALGAGFVPMRKPRKLPAKTIGVDYALEYGSDRLEIHADALVQGERVLIVDDVLATGGTVEATAHLVERAGWHVAGISVAIELEALDGRSRLGDRYEIHSLLQY